MSEMNNIFDQIKQGSQNAPTAVTGSQTSDDLFQIAEEDAEKRRIWTNECELVALCSTGPNANEYTLNELKITQATASTESHRGQLLPIKHLEKPAVPYDGYHILTPEGPVNVHKDKALAWLLNNTLGRIRGGKLGRVLAAVTPKNANLNNSKKAIQVKASKISASNQGDILPTWQKKEKAENGEPLTKTATVALQVEVGEGEKAPNVRGKIENYPIFERKPEYLEDLGSIKVSSSASSSSAVNKGHEQEKAVAELKRLINVALSEDVQL